MSSRDSGISAALSAVFPAEMDDRWPYDGASVSVTMTSHAKHLPADHGICVTPSGRFPSARRSLGVP